MKVITAISILIISLSALAERFQSKVHSIDTASKQNDPHLIMMDNGRVIFVDYHDTELLDSFRDSLKKRDTLKLEVDEENNFLGAESIEPEAFVPPVRDNRKTVNFSYDPSVVSSGAASSIFRRMRRDYQNESQCYNRAHIWAWEEYQNSGLKSVKHFLFFTRRYIRNYRYKWWFHVSPSVKVSGQGARILDRRYTSGHRSVSSWTRNFVHSGRRCPVVYKYYDYRNNQESEDCYLIPVSMYFWQPRDIERRDRTGHEKTQFYQSEIDYAYWEAF